MHHHHHNGKLSEDLRLSEELSAVYQVAESCRPLIGQYVHGVSLHFLLVVRLLITNSTTDYLE